MKLCANCEKKFRPKKDNPGQEYCSEKCWRQSTHGQPITYINGEPVW